MQCGRTLTHTRNALGRGTGLCQSSDLRDVKGSRFYRRFHRRQCVVKRPGRPVGETIVSTVMGAVCMVVGLAKMLRELGEEGGKAAL